MEIVIKIQEHDKAVIDRFVNGEGFEVLPTPIVDKVIRAVRNGTPLPERHGRLIDISEYEDNYFNVAIQYDDGNHIHEKYTNMIPTIIEAEKGAEK